MAGPPPNAGVAGEPRGAWLLGRETKGEVVLVPRLRAALEKLNSTLPPEAIAAAISGIGRVSPPPLKWRISVKSPAKRPDMKADTKRNKNLVLVPQMSYFQA
ncbi:MAG: hypothetical protein AB1813_19645 [Verrucomicrobiota bacterium]